jgi:D-alanine-D-alanine ligase
MNTDGQTYGKVAVLMGGESAEREVSLQSGAAVLAALLRQGVNAHAFDPKDKPIWALHEEGFDRAFITLHGTFGEDGTLQGVLETLRIPYTGPGVMASSICMDKWRTKLLWQAVGIPTPEYVMVNENTDFAAVEAQLGLPMFIKSACEGSSLALFKVKAPGELRQAYEHIVKTDPLIIAERFIDGGEYTVGILNDLALPVIKIEPAGEFYDYEAKYLSDQTVYRCPCGLSSQQEEALKALALQAFHIVGGQNWGRVDVMLDAAGNPYLLEINTAPGMTTHSLVPKAAQALGWGFDELVLRILDGAHVG